MDKTEYEIKTTGIGVSAPVRRPLVAFGDAPDENTLGQAYTCMNVGPVHGMALMADQHYGYSSMPVGGVVAYSGAISPSGVGVDIGCGVKAVKTARVVGDLDARSLSDLLDEMQAKIAFGMGRIAEVRSDHVVMQSPLWGELPRELAALKEMAAQQLGTVGGGNHYVDILADETDGALWVAAHFGSRGFGNKVGRHFGKALGARDAPDAPPSIIMADDPLFAEYVDAMDLAGAYAYAGRDIVVAQVLGMLGSKARDTVHNHHNFAWDEVHDGEQLIVVRKGATPAWPGQRGFVGGSMGDIAAIVEGTDAPEASSTYHSTVHGAGRIHSRGWAKGKVNRKTGEVKKAGNISLSDMEYAVSLFGTQVRGGDVDESPMCYRPLEGVLQAMGDTIAVRHRLRPIGVVMAPRGVRSDDG